MSWDLFVMDLPAAAVTVDDIAQDFEPKSLGPRAQLIERIREVVPGADFSDPSWGRITDGRYAIEVNLGDQEEVASFAFHVRGDDSAIAVVAAILGHLRLRAYDPQSSAGGLFTPEDARSSFHAWRAYRDSVIP